MAETGDDNDGGAAGQQGERAAAKDNDETDRMERWLLGALMVDLSDWAEVAGRVSSADFQRESHAAIFTAMAELVAAGRQLHAATLSEKLAEQSLLGMVGGSDYLDALADGMSRKPGRSNARAYAKIVRDRATRRMLVDAGHRIAALAEHVEGSNVEQLVDDAARRILTIRSRRQADGPRRFGEVAAAMTRRLENLSRRGQAGTGVSTGFAELDRVTGGFARSDLVVVGGRPSMGKTALMLNIAERATRDPGDPNAVLCCTAESPAEKIVGRMVASVGRIRLAHFRGGLRPDEWEPLAAALTNLQGREQLYVDDRARTPDAIRTRSWQVAARAGGIKVVFVDALQRIQPPLARTDRGAELEDILRSLKDLAGDLQCPVVVSSYLTRGPEKRGDRRPYLEDLRGSSAIEEIADLVLLVFRRSYYNPDEDDLQKDTMEIIVGKNRNAGVGRASPGPVGSVFMTYDSRFDRLKDG